MSIRFFGVKIYISFLFVAIITLMLFFDKTGLIIPLVFAVFVHESAHLIAMKILKCAPSEIMLIPGSIRIINPYNFSRRKENIILLCGPLSNIFFSFIFYCIGGENILRFSAVQLIVALFNLLPAKGLDGGSLLFNLLISKLSVSLSNLIFILVSATVGFLFVFFSIFSILNGEINPSFLILGIYIIVFTFLKL